MNKIKCIKFPEIGQFRNLVGNINRQANFIGLDENGDAIYDSSKKKPILKFASTTKLHGSNSGISYTNKLGMWTQSRTDSFKLDDLGSHMGFTFFVKSNEEYFDNIINKISEVYNLDLNENAITLYAEWAGKKIQKTVAISLIEKSMFIFAHFKVSPFDENISSYWLPTIIDDKPISNVDKNIYNILDFKTNEIDIDFNMPQLIQNDLAELTQAVEDECPVAKELGYIGIGEGNVFISNIIKISRDIIKDNSLLKELLYNILPNDSLYHFTFNNLKLSCIELNYEKYIDSYILIKELMFNSSMNSMKVKGQKHSVSKTKTLAPVDVEKLESIQDFVDYAVTRNRFEQGLGIIFSDPNEYDVKKTGDLLRWIVNDIMSEEMDVLIENKLEPKDVNKYISFKAREMFFKELEV